MMCFVLIHAYSFLLKSEVFLYIILKFLVGVEGLEFKIYVGKETSDQCFQANGMLIFFSLSLESRPCKVLGA